MQTEYLHSFLGFNKLRFNIARMAMAIRKSGIEFDAIAFRGNSGALLAGPLATLLKKHLILVRKDLEYSHSHTTVEGCSKRNCRYIIVDDLIVSGKTVQEIFSNVSEALQYPVLVGIFMVYGTTYHLQCAIDTYKFEAPIYVLRHKIVKQYKPSKSKPKQRSY